MPSFGWESTLRPRQADASKSLSGVSARTAGRKSASRADRRRDGPEGSAGPRRPPSKRILPVRRGSPKARRPRRLPRAAAVHKAAVISWNDRGSNEAAASPTAGQRSPAAGAIQPGEALATRGGAANRKDTSSIQRGRASSRICRSTSHKVCRIFHTRRRYGQTTCSMWRA